MKTLMFVAAAALLTAPVLAQDATAAAPTLPNCSAKVTDSCQQTPAQQARAMTGAQADARDARNGGAWTPDKTASGMSSTAQATKKAHRSNKKAHHATKRHVRVTRVTVTPAAAAPAAAPQ